MSLLVVTSSGLTRWQDGGGIRGFGTLLMLAEVMKSLTRKPGDEAPRPRDCFQFITGAGIGGVLALLLGRLGLTVPECISAYWKISTLALRRDNYGSASPVCDGEKLKRVVDDIVRQYYPQGQELPLVDESEHACKVCVFGVQKDAVESYIHIRTYVSPDNKLGNVSIAEAAVAVLAARGLFAEAKIAAADGTEISLLDKGFPLGLLNPTELAREEATRTFPYVQIHSIVSIGSGFVADGDVPDLLRLAYRPFLSALSSLLRPKKRPSELSEVKQALRDPQKFNQSVRHRNEDFPWVVYRRLQFGPVEDVGPNDFLSINEVSQAVENCLQAWKKHINPFLLLGGESTALHWAAWTCQPNRVERLLAIGIGKDSKDVTGRTPLSYAAEAGHNTLVATLLEMGASPNSVDDESRTPLSYAAEAGHRNVIMTLLDKGADPDLKDRKEKTPIFYAGTKYKAALKILFDNGRQGDCLRQERPIPPTAAIAGGRESTAERLRGVREESRQHEASMQEFRDSENDGASLQDELLQGFAESYFDQPRSFAPNGLVDTLITMKALRRKLQAKSDDETLLKWIEASAKHLFAICIYFMNPVELRQAMLAFQRQGVDDRSLPVEDVSKQNPAFSDGSIWPASQLKQFSNTQWEFCVPVFKKGEIHYLAAQTILPFPHVVSTSKGSHFGRIHQVTIYGSHYQPGPEDLNKNPPTFFALKEVDAQEGEKELDALKLASALGHDHILNMTAAFTRGLRDYIILEWAEGGNLRDFWQTPERAAWSKKLVQDTVLQFYGLADALCSLHNENLRHGDLKPENILRFVKPLETDLGLLKITDFGSAKKHNDGTAKRTTGTTSRYITIRYEAPEAFIDIQSHRPRSRLYDIWSIGCIFLEHIIWLLFGDKGLAKFEHDLKQPTSGASGSAFFIIKSGTSKPRATVNKAVLHWMNYILEKGPECARPTAIRDLLKLVRTRLLVISLPSENESAVATPEGRSFEITAPGRTDSLATSSKPGPHRASAAELREVLGQILQKGKDDDQYWLASEFCGGMKAWPETWRAAGQESLTST
ncbi:putative serine threonine protein kinase [Rosellinia necatrix]|uniref:Putative serine threonine protein kinase n=1 Tax=Rosellinia necatrix TaxID=77044 RepID=A0A1W2TWJ5_ROSNE|nr:putative serine threonine protein kinase [Rosellinia necatrix]